jgi:hypothetical protein
MVVGFRNVKGWKVSFMRSCEQCLAPTLTLWVIDGKHVVLGNDILRDF